MVIRLQEAELQTVFGSFTEYLYYNGQKESIALIKGDVTGKADVLCRIHSACLTGHVFNSIECDCREQMLLSQHRIEEQGEGLVIWLDQEGKGNGHLALMSTVRHRRAGIGQTDAYEQIGFKKDARDYTVASEILRDLGINSIKLLTNNPDKVDSLKEAGIKISGTVPIHIDPTDNPYLSQTYIDKIKRGHSIPSF